MQKGLNPDVYREAIQALGNCQSVFHHLTPNFAAELLESVTSWAGEALQSYGRIQVLHIMERILDDRGICRVTQYMDGLECAFWYGRTDTAAANKQKLLNLLFAIKEGSEDVTDN